MASISTHTPNGNDPTPTADRACAPFSFPKMETSISLAPFTTRGWLVKSAPEFTKPVIFRIRTLSKSPHAAGERCAGRGMAACDASHHTRSDSCKRCHAGHARVVLTLNDTVRPASSLHVSNKMDTKSLFLSLAHFYFLFRCINLASTMLFFAPAIPGSQPAGLKAPGPSVDKTRRSARR